MDISAGVKKSGLEEDDFDYIYHLPSANPDQIIWRDPFKRMGLPEKKAMSMAQSMSRLSQHSRHSVREIKQMLDPTLGAPMKHKTSMLRRKNSKKEKMGSDGSGLGRRVSKKMFGSTFSMNIGNSDKDAQSHGSDSQNGSYDFKDIQISADIGDDSELLIPVKYPDIGQFRAMPDFIYRYLNPNQIAIFSFLCMLAMVLQVAVS